MQKLVVLALISSLMLLFLLIGCDSGGGSGGLSDDVIDLTAFASLGAGSISVPILAKALDDAVYGAGDLDGMIISGTLTVSGGGTLYTFASCALDFNNDGTPDVTVNGEFSVVVNGTTTVTFNDLNIVGTPPGMSDPLNATVSGNLVIAATEFTASLTVSGLTTNDLSVEMQIAASGGEPQYVEYATINGTDYTDEFNEALALMS